MEAVHMMWQGISVLDYAWADPVIMPDELY
jgi:hypothetical protein